MSVRFWFHLHQYHRRWRWWLQCTIFFRMAWKHTHFLFGWDLTRLPKADLHVSWLGNQSRPNPHWRWIPKMEPYGTSNVGLSFGFMTGLFPWQSVKQTYWTFEHDVFMFPRSPDTRSRYQGIIVWHAMHIRSFRDWPIFITTRSSTGTWLQGGNWLCHCACWAVPQCQPQANQDTLAEIHVNPFLQVAFLYHRLP